MSTRTITKPLTIALLAVSALLIVGLMTFAGPCVHDDGTASECFNSALGIGATGLFLVGLALFGLMLPQGRALGVVALIAIALAIFIIAAPGNLFPLCMMDTMHCRAVMMPFATLCAVAVMGISAVLAFFSFRG